MYRVKFARKINATTVDLGDVVVCAGSRELAVVMVAETYALPVADTQFESARVKPSFFQISRRTVNHSVSTFDAATEHERVLSNATFPGVTEGLGDRVLFQLVASATIRAENENDAIGGLSRALAREVSGEKQKGSLKDLDIACERVGHGPRPPAVEQNALYTFRRIFQGGDTRT